MATTGAALTLPLNRAATDPQTLGDMDALQPQPKSTHANGKPSKVPETAATKHHHDHLNILAEEITTNLPLIPLDEGARVKVTTSALELASLVRPPVDLIMGLFCSMSIVSAVRLFLHWGAFEAIPAGEGEKISYSDLGRRVGAEEGLLVRIANMLTAASILTHHPGVTGISPPSVSHTPFSRLLLPNQPLRAMFSVLYTNIIHVSTILPEYFDLYGRREPQGLGHIPISFLEGHPEDDYFSLLSRDEKRMQEFMLAMGIGTRRVPVVGVYDMERVLGLVRDRAAGEKGSGIVWVDVGGGDGHTVKEFLGVYGERGLKAEECVVQDLEMVVKAAKKKVEKEGDEELMRVKWVVMDFMKEAPVEGALVYYLRHILRDYSDPVAVTILRNVARALTNPDGRVLIAEQINPDPLAPTDPSSGSPATGNKPPIPLYAAFKDYAMLSIGGKERSLAQFEAVADAAGLKISAVFQDKATPHGVIELVLKDRL